MSLNHVSDIHQEVTRETSLLLMECKFDIPCIYVCICNVYRNLGVDFTFFVWNIYGLLNNFIESHNLSACFVKYMRFQFSHIWAGSSHDDLIKWKHFPHYWPFGRRIHRRPVNSPHKGQWHGALMFILICALNKRLSKQSWGWWFEIPSHSLWRHCNECHLSPVNNFNNIDSRNDAHYY